MSRATPSSLRPDARPPLWVDDAVGLRDLAKCMESCEAIAIDTEGNSLHAYRERLCLLQISAGGDDWLVDTTVDLDLSVLGPALANPAICKVFHDAEYDVLTLKRASQLRIAGIFDTKVAACSLGIEGVGLAAMLERFFGVLLDKGQQLSDWGRRPLTSHQVEYARRDTHWLLELAWELQALLREREELHELEVRSECRRLESLMPVARPDPNEGWRKLPIATRIDARTRTALARLWRMREELAEARDVPVFKILDTPTLVALARARPRDRTSLSAVAGLSDSLKARHGESILRALAAGPDSRDSESSDDRGFTDPEEALGPKAQRVLKALRRWRKDVADRRRTDLSLVLPKATMLALCQLDPAPRSVEQLEDTGLLETWRVARYGSEILQALKS